MKNNNINIKFKNQKVTFIRNIGGKEQLMLHKSQI